MDKGIRQGVIVKFNSMLPQLAELGGKKFRRIILDWAVEEFGCTMAASSTHYAFAKHKAEAETPELVKNLGRAPEKNNGGRKKKVAPVEFVGPVQPLMLTYTPQGDANDAGETAPVQQVFNVLKKADGTVVTENLCLEDARALVQKAKDAKKATLYFV